MDKFGNNIPNMSQAKKALISAVTVLLRPLIKILLRNGLSHAEFTEITRRTYVDVAETDPEFQVSGRKVSASRISVLTGLSRKEVSRIQKIDEALEPELSPNRAEQVVNGWIRNKDFQTPDGDPADLLLEGESVSFSELVKAYSGDMPARAVLDELYRVGAVKKLDDGRIRLRAKAYIPHKGDPEKFRLFGSGTADLIKTMDHNLANEIDDSRLQLVLAYNDLPQEALVEFKQLCDEHSEKTLLLLNDWLSKKDRKVNAEVTGTGRFRAGLGMYYFEEEVEEKDES